MDLIGMIVIAGIGIGIGFVAGILVHSLREPGTGRVSEAEPGDHQRVPVLRIWRDAESGAFLPEVGGEVLESAQRLTAEQHAALSIALVDLYSWMEASSQGMPPLTVDTEPESPARQKSAATAPGGESASEADEQAKVKPASMNILKSLVRTAQKETTQKIVEEPLSIAAQVDDILQEKLEASDLAGQGIRLMDLPNQGMVIMIGLDKYSDIDSVPDEAVQTLIRESVAEWEARTSRDK